MAEQNIGGDKGRGGKYCCIINCSNHSKTLDERIQKAVKLHGFPEPLKDWK